MSIFHMCFRIMNKASDDESQLSKLSEYKREETEEEEIDDEENAEDVEDGTEQEDDHSLQVNNRPLNDQNSSAN